MTLYFQCKLQCHDDTTIGWIEECGAQVGKSVELKTDGRFWDVVEVYKPGIEEEALRKKQANDRNSLPSIIGKK